MRTEVARTLRIADSFPGLRARRIVRSGDVPWRREGTDNAIPDSSRFAPSQRRWRATRGAYFFASDKSHRRRRGGNRRSLGSAAQIHGTRPGRAIPGNAKERVDFLFSTAIADVPKKKEALRQRRRAFRVRRSERSAFRRFGRMLRCSQWRWSFLSTAFDGSVIRRFHEIHTQGNGWNFKPPAA
jgi:hypothetical protein